MAGIDYRKLFSDTLTEMLDEALEARGVHTIYEDELEAIVSECTAKAYWPSISEFRRVTGQSSIASVRASYKSPLRDNGNLRR